MENRPINVLEWVANNQQAFLPPVCNHLMHSSQLKIMFVGGPNSRKDFHLEEGEEFFYQLQNGMVLNVMERGVFKQIEIKEGEVCLLPGRTFHSPQRRADSLGLVVERQRSPSEYDSLCYFVDNSDRRLFQRWFYCKDLVKDLPPLINEFKNSDAFATGRPTETSIQSFSHQYEPDDLLLDSPINLMQHIRDNSDQLQKFGKLKLFDKPMYKSEVIVYGEGQHTLIPRSGEIYIWQLTGSGEIHCCQQTHKLNDHVTFLVSQNSGTIPMDVVKAVPSQASKFNAENLAKLLEKSVSTSRSLKQIESSKELNLTYELLNADVCTLLFNYFEQNVEYYSGELTQIKIYGKNHQIPRQQVAYGEPGKSYHFSGVTVPAKPWDPVLLAIRQLLFEITGVNFNFVLINRYASGNDYIGEHRDNESDLDSHAPIASISLGEPRDFVLRHVDRRKGVKDAPHPVKILLEHGSLLLMNFPTNQKWYHSLPKRKKSNGVRINLTFRKLN